jgi:hypothetical protein
MRGGRAAGHGLPALSQGLEIEIAQICDLDLDRSRIGGTAARPLSDHDQRAT